MAWWDGGGGGGGVVGAGYCIRHIFRAQIFSRFWTKWGNLQELNFMIF